MGTFSGSLWRFLGMTPSADMGKERLPPQYSHSHDQESEPDSSEGSHEDASTFSWRKETSPDRQYILDQISYCITNFENSRWAESARYGSVIERIKDLCDM